MVIEYCFLSMSVAALMVIAVRYRSIKAEVRMNRAKSTRLEDRNTFIECELTRLTGNAESWRQKYVAQANELADLRIKMETSIDGLKKSHARELRVRETDYTGLDERYRKAMLKLGAISRIADLPGVNGAEVFAGTAAERVESILENEIEDLPDDLDIDGYIDQLGGLFPR